METSKIPPIVQRLRYWQVCEVLVPEGNHFSLSNKSSQLVLPRRCELAKLYASDFAADRWSQVNRCDALSQEFGKAWVGIEAVVSVFKRLEGRVLLAAPSGKIALVLFCTVRTMLGSGGIAPSIYLGGLVAISALLFSLLRVSNCGKLLVWPCTGRQLNRWLNGMGGKHRCFNSRRSHLELCLDAGNSKRFWLHMNGPAAGIYTR